MKAGTFVRTVLAAAVSLTLCAATAMAKVNAPALTGDDAIAQKVLHELRSYPYYTIFDDVNFRVDNGTVQLLGEVTQPWKKSALGKSISGIPGVVTLDNELKVLPLSTFDDRLRAQIARAIYRDPVLSRYSIQVVPPIHIIVDSGHVTLTGVVNTDLEKQVAGVRANSSLSFGPVANDLRVEQPAPKRN
jgi:hyperosmotically inducible periplasmic protein